MKAEVEMEWWPDTTPHVGNVVGAGPERDDDAPLATLWIPDPEQRRGWRERYVYSDKPKPNGKPIGFRR